MEKHRHTFVTRSSHADEQQNEREAMITQEAAPPITTKKKRRRVQRKLRRDAGSRRLKARDRDVLRFGAEQTFVRFDSTGEYLAPDYAKAVAEPTADQIADTTPSAKRSWPADLRHRLMAVSRLMRKLEGWGYVEIIQPWADQPAWYRVTTAGLREIGLEWEEIPFPEKYEDLEARLRHDRYFTSHNHVINQVRLLLARGGASMPRNHEWRGERTIESVLPPREHGKRRPHKADGIIYLKENGSWPIENADRTKVLGTVEMRAGCIVGIETECTQKSEARLLEILPDLLSTHDYVWYFCTSATIKEAVAAARKKAEISDDDRRRLRILLLEDYL